MYLMHLKYIAYSIHRLVKCLCKDPGLTSEEIEEMKKTSREKEDHLLLVLLFAAQEFCNGGEVLEQQDKCI